MALRRTDGLTLHRRMKALGEQEADAQLVRKELATSSGSEIEPVTERLEDVGRAAPRRHRAVAVLGDDRAGGRGDEGRRGRDVERV